MKRSYRNHGIEGWLDDYILCGWPHPIRRRQALEEMINDGFTTEGAINALCWYQAIAITHVKQD